MSALFNVLVDNEVIAVYDSINSEVTGGYCLFEEQEAIDLCNRCSKLGFNMEYKEVSQ